MININRISGQQIRYKVGVSGRYISIDTSTRPYTEIPGPKSLPIIGNIFRFIPGIGDYAGITGDEVLKRLGSQYGKIVRLDGIPNRKPSVFLFDPELCERMYRLEGPWPARVTMKRLQNYCMLNEGRRYPGLFISQGEEWYNLRSRVNQAMMQPSSVHYHIEQIDQVARDFIDRIREMRDPTTLEVPKSFNKEVNKWALETICLIAFDHRIGCFESNLTADSDPQRMIEAAMEMFVLFYELEILPSLLKYNNQHKLTRLIGIYDTLTEISNKYITKAMERLKSKSKSDNQEERSMLERLLVAKGEMIAKTMAQDMLFAGVDTTANSVGKALYMIATHPNVQKKLRAEVDKALPQVNSPFTHNTMNEIPYLKACIQEALRVSPLVIGGMRTMPEDVVLGGYRIPKGTDVVALHGLMSGDEEYFPEPDKFIPERWTREASAVGIRSVKDTHPFASMPFGFGPRGCIGRRFADLQMQTLISRIVKRFRLEWHHGPLETKYMTINSVITPLQFKFLDR